MAMTLEEAEKAAITRVSAIDTRQKALATSVARAQTALLNDVLAKGEDVLTTPALVQAIVGNWERRSLTPVVNGWVEGLAAVNMENGAYFRAIAEDLDAKDYKSIAYAAKEVLQDRFGFTPKGALKKGGFFASFLEDPATRRAIQSEAWKAKSSGAGLQEFKRSLTTLIQGKTGGSGLLERHFNTYAYDTYQQADAFLQDHYAEKLGLPGALYLGGEVRGTRAFCHSRVNKAWTREEIASWKTLNFAGKPSPYNPFFDRGGYNCRHHYHYITAKMLVRRRRDLVIDEDGTLRYSTGKKVDTGTPAAKVKPKEAPKPTVAPVEEVKSASTKLTAKSVREAEAYAVEKGFAKSVNYGTASVEQANEANEIVTAFFEKYNVRDLGELNIQKPGSGKSWTIGKDSNGVYIYERHGAAGSKTVLSINRNALTPEAITKAKYDYHNYATKAKANLEYFEKTLADKPDLFSMATDVGRKNAAKLRAVRESAKYERWKVGEGWQDTLVHELGHKLQDDITGLEGGHLRKNVKVITNEFEADRIGLRIFEELKKAKDSGEIYQLSQYAATNEAEFFAEAFCQYTKNPEALPAGIKSFMETYLTYARR